MKKKILHIITKSSWGGAQKYLVDIVSHTRDNYTHVVSYGNNSFGGENIFEKKLRAIDIPLRPIYKMDRDIDFSAEIVSLYRLFFLIKQESPDILHLNSPKAAGFGALAGLMLGIKKRIYTVHGLALAEDRPSWQLFLIKLASWFTFLFSTDIIFVSKHEMGLVSYWRSVRKKGRVIENGIEKPDFLDRENARKEIEKVTGKSLDNTFIIGSIAELTENKGQQYLIQAIAQLENKNWAYVHWGTGHLEKELRGQVSRLGLESKVFFLGFDAQAKEKLKALDLFVLPSIKEGLGYVLLEAGHAGLPVVASRVGGIPEIIINGETGWLIDTKSPDQLAARISRLLENKEEKRVLAQNLKSHVQNNFSIKRMIGETEKVYNS